jgi:type I restriction enzyme M protein
MAHNNNDAAEPIEKQLWKAADKLRKNIDAAEYKHVVLGLIFLRYISDAFENLYEKLKKGEGEYEGADPEDRDEYKAENVFFVPPKARWAYLQSTAKSPEIGKDIDEAMDAIEKENPSLRGVLPKVYARGNIDPTSLGGLIDLMSNVALGEAKERSADVLGHVFEYFLGEFALAEGKKGGQFYTPTCVVRLLVEMLEPYEGRVLDPCCGSGGMFVQSEKFVMNHQGNVNQISIFGQESNLTTWRLAKMNLAIRGIDSSQVKWNNEGSFLNDAHKDLKADYVLANPPFNDSDWGGDLLRKDGRWQYGTPPTNNANYAWIQHFLYHLSHAGKAGFVLANSSLAAENSNENEIRQAIIEKDLVECIVSLPGKLFHSTPIPVSLWFVNRNKITNTKNREKEILFIDASKIGKSITRTHNTLLEKDRKKLVATYKSWKFGSEDYKDIPGFCKSISLQQVRDNNYILFPATYIDIDFVHKETSVSQMNQVLGSQWDELHTSISVFFDSLKKLDRFFNPLDFNTPLPNKFDKFKLGDMMEVSNERLGNREEPEILTCTENAGLIFQKDRFSKRVATENTSKYKIVRETDVVYNPYLLWAGAIDQCWIVKEGITSPAYIILNIKGEFNPTLVGRLVKSKMLIKMYDGISIGAIQRRRRAPVEKFLELEVLFPSIIDQKYFTEISQEIQYQLSFLRKSESELGNFIGTMSDFWLSGKYDGD